MRLTPWLLLAAAGLAEKPPRMPMQVEYENSAEYGWLKKKVYESRSLEGPWTLDGQGSMQIIPDDGERARVTVEVNINERRKLANGNLAFPAVTLRRAFPGEDWTAFNRLSVWVRPRMSGFNVFSFSVNLYNDGVNKVPDLYRREGNHNVTLPNHRWTRVLWEIAPHGRDKVTAVTLNYFAQKLLPDPGDSVAFDVAELTLERVDPDHYEGWQVAPGKISFSHTGYQAGASKTALASDLKAREFTVVRVNDGTTVLRKPVAMVKTRLGEFQNLDFSELRDPGMYALRAGDVTTRPFRIGANAWTSTIWKTINFFYGERCGMAIPGIHDACHRDWQATLGDLKIIMNGGWHDAGDLSQGLINTAEATYAMFALAERLQARGEEPELAARLIEEAKWGLDWILKVRFDGGYRMGFASNNVWTNGIIGDADDRTRAALNNPNVNYLAAQAGAIAYRVLKDTEPDLAARSLRIAEDDWRYAIAGKETPENLHTVAFTAAEMEIASQGILASLELLRATGRDEYARKARELARILMDSQQRTYVGRAFPLAGFFYTGPDRKSIFHQFHRAADQAPIVAMAKMCDAFPDDPDWIRWYSVVALHSEYQKKAATTTAPYSVLPAYVYKDDEHVQVPEAGDRYQASRDVFRGQVLQGFPMGDGYYLKAFPVWFNRRGNYGVLLSQAKALSVAAHLRGDWDAADLAQKQLQWVVGRNPFVQSTMWGEGYDFTQQYTVSSGDFVGSLPVGMMTRGNADAPYWPAQNGFVFKEVWVHPSARWLWLMCDLAGPAMVVDGVSRTVLPEGVHKVNGRTVALLPGGIHRVDARLDFTLSSEVEGDGEVTIRLTATGTGRHRFAIRADNLEIGKPSKELRLPGQHSWKARIRDRRAPWVALVIADDDFTKRRELIGGE